MPRTKLPPLPRYRQTYPAHLATHDELQALGLRPTGKRAAALLDYVRGDTQGTTALYDRASAVPVESRPNPT